MHNQHAKKVVSDSPGLVDFTIGLVNSVLNLPYRQVKFFVEFQKKKGLWNQFCSSKTFLGLVEKMFGLVNNVTMTFFAPWQQRQKEICIIKQHP